MTGRLMARLAQVRRTTPQFFLLRGALLLLALVGQLVAAPAGLATSAWLVAFVLVAALPAVLPRTGAVTLWILVTITEWLAATLVYGEPVGYLRVVLLATALYGTHVLAAIAAVVPHDSVVDPRALIGWLPRTGLLLVGTALLALVAAALPQLFGGARFLVAALVGFAVMAGLAYYLARLVNRS